MAEMKFACPACAQHITCDEAWAGHPIQCPCCQAAITVPAKVTARATGGSKMENPLVPKPPGGTKLATALPAQQAATTGDRNIPIRNLAPPKPQKSSKLVSLLVTLAVLVAVGAAGYFGWPYLKKWQEDANAKSRKEAAESDGGQVGHIQDLNAVLNATEPGGAGLASLNQRDTPAVPPSAPEGTDPSTPAPQNTETNLPVVPPAYTLEVGKAKIPEGRVNGKVAGTNFVAEMARLDPSGATHVLRFLQGTPASPDREILVYLRLKAGEKVGGQKLTVSSETRSGAPSVVKRWKPNPRYAAQMKTFTGGYAMQLELGQPAEGTIPGKIYLALPDTEKTVVAGIFRAGTSLTDAGTVDPSMMNSAAPTAAPAMDPAQSEAFRRRYGLPTRQ